MDTPDAPRDVYRPSGKVGWSRFVPGLLAAGGVAAALAWLLNAVLNKGFYLIFVAPFFAALMLGGFWFLVLGWSHCRNTRLAATASVVLALVLYLGYYHVGLLQLIGYENAHRVDILPRYVQFRMKTDVARNAHDVGAKRRPQVGPNGVQQAFNWFFSGVELLGVIAVLTATGVTRSSRAYCESCGRWMESETQKLPPGMAATSWEAMAAGDLVNAPGPSPGPAPANVPHGLLTVEHCPSCPASGRASVAYLTVKDVPLPGRPDPMTAKLAAAFKPKPVAGLRTLADHVALEPEEVGAFARTFPGLGRTIEANPGLFAREHEAAHRLAADEVVASGFHDRPVRALATVEEVEPGEAGTILTRKNAVLQTILGTVTTLGGFVPAFAPTLVLFNLDTKPPDWFFGVAVAWMVGWMIFTLVWCLFFARYPTSRFMARKTRQAFEMRVSPLVDLNDPDLVFVDIIPRANWGKIMMENATDIGYVQLNKGRREIVFEGDRQRYRIPVESILSVEHESWSEPTRHQLQSAPSQNHAIVVRAMTKDGPWETWFYQRWNTLRPITEKGRLADAVALESRIRELMDRG
ncbi:hypothetical protein [Aquisphaera insulae]|uniref:hypothetical protein n=1 Tax=Aquisphaera insulae TaxID=2712864 RepID=UPI0013EBF114|nr:hypothetical protein [Aquisphaera insulae]